MSINNSSILESRSFLTTLYQPTRLEQAYGNYLLDSILEVSTTTTSTAPTTTTQRPSAASEESLFRVSGRQAVPFLSRSGINRLILRNVWSVVDPDNVGSLHEPHQFYIVLRLIALAQAGPLMEALAAAYAGGHTPVQAMVVCLKATCNNSHLPLALFEGTPIPASDFLLQNYALAAPSSSFSSSIPAGLKPANGSLWPVSSSPLSSNIAAGSSTLSSSTSTAPSSKSFKVSQRQQLNSTLTSASPASSSQQTTTPTLIAMPTMPLQSIEDAFCGLIDVHDAPLPALTGITTGSSSSNNSAQQQQQPQQQLAGLEQSWMPPIESARVSSPVNGNNNAIISNTKTASDTLPAGPAPLVSISPLEKNVFTGISPSDWNVPAAATDWGRLAADVATTNTSMSTDDSNDPFLTLAVAPSAAVPPLPQLQAPPVPLQALPAPLQSHAPLEQHSQGADGRFASIRARSPNEHVFSMMGPNDWNFTASSMPPVSGKDDDEPSDSFGDFTTAPRPIHESFLPSNVIAANGDVTTTFVTNDTGLSGWDALDALALDVPAVQLPSLQLIPPIPDEGVVSVPDDSSEMAPATISANLARPHHSVEDATETSVEFGEFADAGLQEKSDSATTRTGTTPSIGSPLGLPPAAAPPLANLGGDGIPPVLFSDGPPAGNIDMDVGFDAFSMAPAPAVEYLFGWDALDALAAPADGIGAPLPSLTQFSPTNDDIPPPIAPLESLPEIPIKPAVFLDETHAAVVADETDHFTDFDMAANQLDVVSATVLSAPIVAPPVSAPPPPMSFLMEASATTQINNNITSSVNHVMGWDALDALAGTVDVPLPSLSYPHPAEYADPGAVSGGCEDLANDSFGNFEGVDSSADGSPDFQAQQMEFTPVVLAPTDEQTAVEKELIRPAPPLDGVGDFATASNKVPNGTDDSFGDFAAVSDIHAEFIAQNDGSFGDFAGPNGDISDDAHSKMDEPPPFQMESTVETPTTGIATGFVTALGEEAQGPNDPGTFGWDALDALASSADAPLPSLELLTVQVDNADHDEKSRGPAMDLDLNVYSPDVAAALSDDSDFGVFSSADSSNVASAFRSSDGECHEARIAESCEDKGIRPYDPTRVDSAFYSANLDLASFVSEDLGSFQDAVESDSDSGGQLKSDPKPVEPQASSETTVLATLDLDPTGDSNEIVQLANVDNDVTLGFHVISYPAESEFVSKEEQDPRLVYNSSESPLGENSDVGPMKVSAEVTNGETLLATPGFSGLDADGGEHVATDDDDDFGDFAAVSASGVPLEDDFGDFIASNGQGSHVETTPSDADGPGLSHGKFGDFHTFGGAANQGDDDDNDHGFGDFAAFSDATSPPSQPPPLPPPPPVLLDDPVAADADDEWEAFQGNAIPGNMTLDTKAFGNQEGWNPLSGPPVLEQAPLPPEDPDRAILLSLRQQILHKSAQLPESIRRQIGTDDEHLDFCDCLDANIGMELPLTADRRRRMERCLEIINCLLLPSAKGQDFKVKTSTNTSGSSSSSSTQLASTYWAQVMGVIRNELMAGSQLLNDATTLPIDEHDVVRSDLSTYVHGLGEFVRVSRYIVATVGDLLMLDNSSLLTIDTMASSWCSLVVLEDAIQVENLWKAIEDSGKMMGLSSKQSTSHKLESLMEIRQNAAQVQSSRTLCHFTLQPLMEAMGSESRTDTRSVVHWNGRPFMACAANFLSNKCASYAMHR